MTAAPALADPGVNFCYPRNHPPQSASPVFEGPSIRQLGAISGGFGSFGRVPQPGGGMVSQAWRARARVGDTHPCHSCKWSVRTHLPNTLLVRVGDGRPCSPTTSTARFREAQGPGVGCRLGIGDPRSMGWAFGVKRSCLSVFGICAPTACHSPFRPGTHSSLAGLSGGHSSRCLRPAKAKGRTVHSVCSVQSVLQSPEKHPRQCKRRTGGLGQGKCGR